MKLIFVGSGSAFKFDNYQSNMVFETEQGNRLLIDCGSDARFSLKAIGITHADIESIYISHMHADHVGGLEWMGFKRKFDPTCGKPRLYTSKFLETDLWSHVLSGGMRSVQGEVTDLHSYFDVHAIRHNGSFQWEGLEFQLVQTVHIMDGFSIVPSFGLLFTINGIKTFLTTDTQFSPEQIKDFYNMADLILHDCETGAFESGVHAHYKKLRTLPEKQKGKMWLYHHQDGPLPDAKADGFLGFIKKGQVFDYADPHSIFPPT